MNRETKKSLAPFTKDQIEEFEKWVLDYYCSSECGAMMVMSGIFCAECEIKWDLKTHKELVIYDGSGDPNPKFYMIGEEPDRLARAINAARFAGKIAIKLFNK